MTADVPGGLLQTIIAALEAARIPHMVVGSFASTAHGEPRTTRDLDLVIDPKPDQLNELLEALDPERFYVAPTSREMRFDAGRCSTSSRSRPPGSSIS